MTAGPAMRRRRSCGTKVPPGPLPPAMPPCRRPGGRGCWHFSKGSEAMRIPILALALLLGWPTFAGAELAEPGTTAVRAWQEAAAAFDQAGSAACPEPAGPADPAAVERARDAFRDLVLRWQAARTWLVGPAVP